MRMSGYLKLLPTVVVFFFGPNESPAQVCKPTMTPSECVDAQLTAVGKILGEYRQEIARLQGEIDKVRKLPPVAQVGIVPCYKKFNPVEGATALVQKCRSRA